VAIPYDEASMLEPDSDLERSGQLERSKRSWLTVAAFSLVLVPFLVAVAKLLFAGGGHIFLSDDISLIDLHTRRAMSLDQQLGVFDRFGWSHPGPALYYLLALVGWLLGSGAKALFLGATLINAAASLGILAVVRRRSGPLGTLLAAVIVLALLFVLSPTAAGSTAASETAMGLLMSPWNATVILIPFLLFVTLAAAGADRSPLSLLGALVLGSFLIQTDLSTAPVVVVLLVAGSAVALITVVGDRRRARASGKAAPGLLGARGWWLSGALLGLFVLAWIPPLSEEASGHPGNLTLIWRFFNAGYPGSSLSTSLRATVALVGVTIFGPQELLGNVQAAAPRHLLVGVLASGLLFVALGLGLVVAWRRAERYAAGLCAAALLGLATLVIALTRVVGTLFGYLVLWALGLVAAGVLGLGLVLGRALLGSVSTKATRGLGGLLVALCLVASVGLVVHIAGAPSLASVGDPQVARLATMVSQAVPPGSSVAVNDDGAGGPANRLEDLWRFFGLFDWLDDHGYHPTVNAFWRSQLGQRYLSTGHESWTVVLQSWSPPSVSMLGYRGRVGDMAVFARPGPP
jgi:hypothetical protein